MNGLTNVAAGLFLQYSIGPKTFIKPLQGPHPQIADLSRTHDCANVCKSPAWAFQEEWLEQLQRLCFNSRLCNAEGSEINSNPSHMADLEGGINLEEIADLETLKD